MKAVQANSDQYSRVALFGVCFWDTVADVPIEEGLVVRAYPANETRYVVDLQANRSGIQVLHDAPGLSRTARGKGDKDFWKNLPEKRLLYVFEVNHTREWFHPTRFTATLPVEGLFAPELPESAPPTPHKLFPPPAGRAIFPLYSSVVRPSPVGMAVLRADLGLNGSEDVPAPWALMVAEQNKNIIARAVADNLGKIAIHIPYLQPQRRKPVPISSVPIPASGVTSVWEWPITLRIFHSPTMRSDSIPDYYDLFMQPEARLIDSPGTDSSDAKELREISLLYGQELTLKTQGYSNLWIAPAVPDLPV